CSILAVHPSRAASRSPQDDGSALDILRPRNIVHAVLLVTRASSRDGLMMEQDAAPAGGARNPAPGRLRDPARAALRPLREVLRWTGTGAFASSQETRAWS